MVYVPSAPVFLGGWVGVCSGTLTARCHRTARCSLLFRLGVLGSWVATLQWSVRLGTHGAKQPFTAESCCTLSITGTSLLLHGVVGVADAVVLQAVALHA